MSVSGFSAPTPDAYPFNDRILVDAGKVATGTLPASTSTSNTTVIDLQNITPFPTTETIIVGVAYTASANGNTSASNGTIVLMDSADNTTFTNIATLGTVPIVLSGASVVAAAAYEYKLPPGCRRYIKASSIKADSANLADSVLTLQLQF
jgi:hypothetical protein